MTKPLMWMALASTVALAACVASPEVDQEPSADRLSGAPADFSLEVSIVRGKQAPDRHEAESRASRYILLADGSLHYAPENPTSPDGRAIDWLPPLTRILSRTQVADVWSLASRLGFTDASAADPPVNIEIVPAPSDAVTTIVQLAGNEVRWSLVRRATHDQPPDPAMSELVRKLAQLAWVDERPPESGDGLVMPKRYDFGPDPYARFRRGNRP